MIDRKHKLPVTKQCRLLALNRSTAYYRPKGESEENLAVMRTLDELWPSPVSVDGSLSRFSIVDGLFFELCRT